MNRLIKLLPLLTLLFGCTEQPKGYRQEKLDPSISYDDVYLIMGQSNASGCTPFSYLEESQPELYQKYITGNEKVMLAYDVIYRADSNFQPTKFGCGDADWAFGPEIGIAEYISQFDKTSYIVKGSLSGSCLQTQWVSPEGEKYNCYNHSVSFVKAEMETLVKQGKHPRIRGVFWMQGESDSLLHNQENYYTATKNLIHYLQIDLNAYIYDYFNFVDAYIYDHGPHWEMPELINQAKQQVADENEHCYCIKTNGEDETAITLEVKSVSGEGDDHAHYDSSSMVLLGKTAGEYLVK